MGGWATTLTQDTIITPEVVREAITVFNDILNRFNDLTHEEPLKSLGPIGSCMHYEHYIALKVNVEVGDVDMLVSYPIISDLSFSKSVELYNFEFIEFLNYVKPDGIDVEETKRVSGSAVKIIITLPSGAVIQIDMIATWAAYEKWSKLRYTPPVGRKGFIVGSIFSSIQELMYGNFSLHGVKVKWKGRHLVQYRLRKDTTVEVISSDYKNCIRDFTEFLLRNFAPVTRLYYDRDKEFIGINNLEFPNIFREVRTMNMVLYKNRVFKHPKFRHLLNNIHANRYIHTTYVEKMKKAFKNSKFNKAKSKNAFKQIEQGKADAQYAIQIATKELLCD